MYEKEVLELYQKCGITSFPVDCDKILKCLGYKTLTYQVLSENDEEFKRKLFKVSSDAFIVRELKTLYINAKSHGRRQLFTKAHEVAHVYLGTDDETEADEFATTLLAPQAIIWRKHLCTADAIMKEFGLSVQAANNAVMLRGFKPSDEIHRRFIEYFSQHNVCELLPVYQHHRISQTQSTIDVKPAKIASEYPSGIKHRVAPLKRKLTRLNNALQCIDCLAPDAMQQYKEIQRKIWEVEKKIEVLEDRIPEITRSDY